MRKRKVVLGRHDNLSAKILTPGNILYKCSFNVGGEPQKIANEFIAIAVKHKLINTLPAEHPYNIIDQVCDQIGEDFSVGLKNNKFCIIKPRILELPYGFWISLEMYFHIHSRSPKLAEQFLALLFNTKFAEFLWVIEESYHDILDNIAENMYDDDENVDDTFSDVLENMHSMISNMRTIGKKAKFDIETIKKYRSEYPLAGKTIKILYDYLLKYSEMLLRAMKAKKDFVQYELTIKNSIEERNHPSELFGLCVSINNDPSGPTTRCMEMIDSNIMEASYAPVFIETEYYFVDKIEKNNVDFDVFLKDTIKCFRQVYTLDAEIPKKQNIWQILAEKNYSFQNVLSYYTAKDTWNQQKLSQPEEGPSNQELSHH